jgi:hypothetical protein
MAFSPIVEKNILEYCYFYTKTSIGYDALDEVGYGFNNLTVAKLVKAY